MGTVIVISLILWIPASCIVHHIDKKRQHNEEEERDWMRADVSQTPCGLQYKLKTSIINKSAILLCLKGVGCSTGPAGPVG